MLRSGLVSITFRNMSSESVIQTAKKAHLEGIEWGGDIHCPHGDKEIAYKVGQMTRENGLEVTSYGSYYRVGVSEKKGLSFTDVLSSAKGLGTDLIRVWAGESGPNRMSAEDGKIFINDCRRICHMAKEEGIKICFEHHQNTATEYNFTLLLLTEALADIDNLLFHWQPPVGMAHELCLDGLKLLIEKKKLAHIHTFSWDLKNGEIVRVPLAAHSKQWNDYLMTSSNDKQDHFALLEFVNHDSVDELYKDSETLHQILSRINVH